MAEQLLRLQGALVLQGLLGVWALKLLVLLLMLMLLLLLEMVLLLLLL